MENMTAQEFHEWMALEKIEPYGEFAEYLRAGIIASTIANVYRGKNQKAFTPFDFMPKFDAQAASSPEQLRAALMAIKAAQDSLLKANAKREKANAENRRAREIRKQTPGSRAHRPEKSAR